MKTNKLVTLVLISIFAITTFTSCDPQEEIIKTPAISTGVFVLNSGKWKSNNASLTYFDFATGFASSTLFSDKNNRGLGDTGQDMIVYGSKLYISVNTSSLIEVVNAKTGVSIKTIPMTNDAGAPASPRSLTSSNGKVYVVLYDGHVAQLDTTTLAVTKKIQVGANPDGSVIANNKLYVANSGGYNIVPDSTVSVINLTNFAEEKKIKVNMNPQMLKVDSYGDVYVASFGDYGAIKGKFQRIDVGTDKVTDINLNAQGFDIIGDKAYVYTFSYDTNWQAADKKIAVYDVKNEEIISTNIITTTIDKTPYSINIDPTNNDIYLGVTDYVNNGKMYCFDKNGVQKFTFTTGVNPIKTIFITK